MSKSDSEPSDGTLLMRTIAMPEDTNAEGDIFGGWLLSLMDQAGASLAIRRVQNRVVTVGIDSMNFHKPVFVGDEVSCYGTITDTGDSSLTIDLESWVRRSRRDTIERVTEGLFTYVCIDENRNPIAISE